MSRTVDLVIVGMTAAARAAAIDAAHRRRQVLVVGESRDDCYCHQLRRSLDAAADGCRRRVAVLTGVEVVWVDGTTAVEVILLRKIKTGRLIGINTGAVLLTTALQAGVVAETLRPHAVQVRSE